METTALDQGLESGSIGAEGRAAASSGGGWMKLGFLIVGVLIGTYSSVYVASPILLAWQTRRKS